MEYSLKSSLDPVSGFFYLLLFLTGFSVSASAQVGFELAVDSPVLASRGDATVTQADFDVFLDRVPEDQRATFVSSPQRIGDVLHRLLRARQVFNHASGEGVWSDSIAAANLYQGLVMAGADYYLSMILWPQERLDNYEEQARELFLTNPDLIRPETHVSFSGFFVAAEPIRGELDAMRSIINVYDLLREDSDFDTLIERYSEDDPIQSASGRRENLPLSGVGSDIAAVLARLPAGEISQPFRTPEGWRIIQLHERRRPEVKQFEDVAHAAKRIVERRHHDAVRERFFRALAAEPVVFEENAIADLLARHGGRFSLSTDLEPQVRGEIEALD